MSKEIIRKKFLDLRKNNFRNIGVEYTLINNILTEQKFLKKNIGAYFPINYEIDSFKVLKKFQKLGYKISLPVIKKKTKWIFMNGPSMTL